MMDSFNIKADKNYRRYNGDVLTGKEIQKLLKLATPAMQAIILLDIVETDEKPTIKLFK